jgi:hypothetical protein
MEEEEVERWESMYVEEDAVMEGEVGGGDDSEDLGEEVGGGDDSEDLGYLEEPDVKMVFEDESKEEGGEGDQAVGLDDTRAEQEQEGEQR